jgi:hypothetical protein
MIVAEHPSESLAPDDWAVKFANGGGRLHQPVAEPLMISLAVIMADVLRNRAPNGSLSSPAMRPAARETLSEDTRQ